MPGAGSLGLFPDYESGGQEFEISGRAIFFRWISPACWPIINPARGQGATRPQYLSITPWIV